MQSLYKITEDHLELISWLEESGGELTEEMIVALETNKEALFQKGESYAAVIRKFEDRVDLINKEIERLQDLKKKNEKSASSLRLFLKNAMEVCGVSTIESDFTKISIQKNPRSVEIIDPQLIPSKFFTQPPTPPPVVSKTLIKKALESGEVVLGAKMSEPSTRLVIK